MCHWPMENPASTIAATTKRGWSTATSNVTQGNRSHSIRLVQAQHVSRAGSNAEALLFTAVVAVVSDSRGGRAGGTDSDRAAFQ